MFEFRADSDISKNYQLLQGAIDAHLRDEKNLIANLANIASFIYTALPDVNWAGFYLAMDGELVLGPFCGKPACTRIPIGRGVCGTSAEKGEIIVVPDVHAFDGHIACDSQSNSEIVLPLFIKGRVFGVLDIDSPMFDRFSQADVDGLAKIANSISRFLEGM
ncbi:MAG: GAF domain-containing protein [Defluviitaleaceae bacterium]|nr:GAF domain-containing protein [Defluviitaleaceae bacterium]